MEEFDENLTFLTDFDNNILEAEIVDYESNDGKEGIALVLLIGDPDSASTRYDVMIDKDHLIKVLKLME